MTDYNKAKGYAFRLLSIRPRSAKEMESRLRQRGFAKDLVAQLVDELLTQNYLNDLEFAKSWVHSRVLHHQRGFAFLRMELREKGINKEIADQALAELEGEFDEHKVALELALARKEKFKGLHREKAKKRIYDLLNRRGFSYDVVYDVMREIF